MEKGGFPKTTKNLDSINQTKDLKNIFLFGEMGGFLQTVLIQTWKEELKKKKEPKDTFLEK